MKRPGFQSKTCARDYLGGYKWILLDTLVYIGPDGRTYTVERGFITDHATARIGRLALLSYGAMHSRASILHDWMYASGIETRKQCDRRFAEALELEGLPSSDRIRAYVGVRLFGGFAWRSHRNRERQALRNAHILT